jgi:adenine phosphoribosyltransferase
VKDAAFVISLPDLGGEQRLTEQGLELVKLCEFDGE